MSGRLKSALEAEDETQTEISEGAEESSESESDVVTTDEELEGYHIVRAICAEVVDPARIARLHEAGDALIAASDVRTFEQIA